MVNSTELLKDTGRVVEAVSQAIRGAVYGASVSVVDDIAMMMARVGLEKEFILVSEQGRVVEEFSGQAASVEVGGQPFAMKRCGLTYANLKAAWEYLAFLRPQSLGLAQSFGAGDRLGLATPGHVQAIRQGGMRPIFCQQSIREMTRTGRKPEDVMNDACWGVFQAGWREGFGADADHLKLPEFIDTCLAAGFTFFTIDPGDHVDSSADKAGMAEVEGKYAGLPWAALGCSGSDCLKRYGDKTITLPGAEGDFVLSIRYEDVLRAGVKYGRAIAHIKMMYEHLKSKAGVTSVELEVSVDETATPTRIVEHYYVASELKRLGVEWVSLAPRFVGDFEKGVDYIGDLGQFRSEFGKHVGVVKALGPYKISLHSGSDKFSIYPIAAELAGGLVHLKTAGTSYLEALRAIAHVSPELFREILVYAKERYPEDRATYHVSAQVEKVVDGAGVCDADLPGVLDQFDTREVCHVTFGSVLRDTNADGTYKFRERFFQALRDHEQVYYDILESHIGKHIEPFGK